MTGSHEGRNGIDEWQGVVDLSRERSRLRIVGADRTRFLHGQCTNDIQRLRVGECCYAAFLDAKGKMRGEGHIICQTDAFLLEVNPGLTPSLEKFIITEDVIVEDVTARMGEWLVIGEGATSLPANAVTFRHPLGLGVISAEPMMETVAADALGSLYIEAATPRWGVDMDESTIPIEAGLEKRAISYDKGCYIGQETIARIRTYGHVNRRLVQLIIQPQAETPVPPVPRQGDKLLAERREVGWVTSAAFSARLGKLLALGYVRREFAVAGVKLKLDNHRAEVLRVCGE
ncbi:MAG TPA: glycine cleavage T C-terminal barrel domain-containing protein [Verrucomicrobiae bacterium]|nr:glycine cleavage T C-terminal barrel domain-containing protein [Verrucomicrobiae bacterium]